MGDDVATMIGWFHEANERDHALEGLGRPARLAGREISSLNWRAWRELVDDLSPADHARLAQWYDEMHAA